MRFSPLVLTLGLAASAMSVAVSGQNPAVRPDDQVSPRSIALLKAGEAAMVAGNYAAAEDQLETALAVDPKNRAAFIAMARNAEKQKLFGKAIKLTRKALVLEPTDRDAIAVQGEAMVQLGAIPRAKENLAKLTQLCGATCPQVSQLSAAIARGPAMAAATPANSPPVAAKKQN